MDVLQEGQSGHNVRVLQRSLASLNYGIVVLDGKFDHYVTQAVIRFQSDHELTRDGKVGPGTWEVLDSLVPHGIDTYHKSDPIDWDNLSPRIKFMYCKATQGAIIHDSTLIEHSSKAKSKGIYPGAYHFLTFKDSAQSQADNYLSCGFDWSQPGTLPPAIDVEDQVGVTLALTIALNNYILHNKVACIQLLQDFLHIIATETKRIPIIYTYKNFFVDYLNSTTQFGTQATLWLASYQFATPSPAPGWGKPTIWQWDDTSPVDGIGGECDLNIFNGTYKELQEFCNVEVQD